MAANTDKPRITFVDALRLTALAQMINGHTLDAVLSPEWRQGLAYDRYGYMRGLVSVSFMMASGFAYHLTTVARFDKHRASPAAQQKRLRRGVLLLIVGYLLRFRFGMFGDTEWGARALAAFFHIDVLHCIGVALLTMEGLMRVCRSARQVTLIGGLIALTCVALAPLGAQIEITPDNAWWANWLGHQGGSLFPLLPWAGYVIGGMAIGGLVLPQGIDTPRHQPPIRLALAGVVAYGLSQILLRQPLTWVVEDVAWSSRPWFVMQKLGVVLLVIGALAFVMQKLRRLPKPLVILASETLAVYVFHLIALYRFSWSPGPVYDRSLDLGPALGISAIMIVVCFASGFAWHYGKAFKDAAIPKVKARLGAWRRGPAKSEAQAADAPSPDAEG